MSRQTRQGRPTLETERGLPLSSGVEVQLTNSRGTNMKKVRLLLTAILTTLALSAAACTSPTAPDHTLGSDNHTLGSDNHTLGSDN